MSQFIKNLLTRNSSFNPGIKPRLLSRYESNGRSVNEFNTHDKGDHNENFSDINIVGKRDIHFKTHPRFSAEPVIVPLSDNLSASKFEDSNDYPNTNLSKGPIHDREEQITSPTINQELLPSSDKRSTSYNQNSATHEGLREEILFTDDINTRSNEIPLLRDTIFSQPLSSDQRVNTLSRQEPQDPVIKVSIGQIEVKATFEKKEKPPKKKSTPKPRMSLKDYMDNIKNNG